jgi:acylphosphatase
MIDARCRRLRIHGLVQGVGFRYSLHREAQRLGLAGWVRNRRDGTVEAVVAGPASCVEALVAWAHRGPPSARVTRVEVTAEEGDFGDFEQRPTF